MTHEPIDLWLDDHRPAPDGWLLVKTIEDAKIQLLAGRVRRASLDHDLGACLECRLKVCPSDVSDEAWMASDDFMSMPYCSHVGTGYDLVCWMEETGHWPVEKPTVHSMNPNGRQRMRQAIDREWRRREDASLA